MFRHVALIAGLLTIPASAVAQNFPTRPVTIIVPSAPGGTTDFTARLLGEALSRRMGQQFVVENKGGASGNIGTVQVARAAPDGYTLLLAYSGYQVANPALFPSLNWHPVKDFAPIAMAIMAPHVMVVKKDLPAKTLVELLAYARANSGKVNYASSGRGSIQHIGGEQMAMLANLKMTHVPYRGAGPAMNDLIAGNVDLFITTPPSAVGHIQAGTVRALALASKTRHPMLPDVPTTAEAGLPGLELDGWFAVYAPAKTPQAIVDALAKEIKEIVASADFKKRAEENGTYATYMSPQELGEFTERELKTWSDVIKKAGITLE